MQHLIVFIFWLERMERLAASGKRQAKADRVLLFTCGLPLEACS
jgi:hypothetical protein